MTGPKSVKDPGIEDLTIRARRFGLSPDEQRLLDRACEESPALRVSHEVGGDFDRIAVVHAGDEALIARVADRVLTLSRRGGRRGRWAWGFGVAVALLSSVAFAWWAGVVRHRSPALVRDGAPASGELRPGAPLLSASKPREAAADVALSDVVSAAQSPGGPRSDDPPPAIAIARGDARDFKALSYAKKRKGQALAPALATSVAAAPDAETAEACFRKANAARRAGDFGTAGALYARLQSMFPNSDEARLSYVSLGKLLLSSGNALGAEKQFALYLAVGGQELTEEALVGRAESLQRLGRTAEERQTWQRLLQDAPASVYVTRAKERLHDL